MSQWQREDEFKGLLDNAVKKGSKNSIEKVVQLAVAEEKWVSWRCSVSFCHDANCSMLVVIEVHFFVLISV